MHSLRHSFTSHPSRHPRHASPFKHPKPSATFMFHSSALWLLRLYDYSTVVALVVFFLLFSFCLFVSCVPLFLYKMIFFLLQCVSPSVCLSLSVWPSSWLSGCRWKSGVTQWATSSGGIVWGDTLPLVPRGPNRRGLVLLPLSSRSSVSVCLNVS